MSALLAATPLVVVLGAMVGLGWSAARAGLAGLTVATAAIGNVVAPHNLIAGCATVGLVAREGEILKRTAPVCLGYALAGGALLRAVA